MKIDEVIDPGLSEFLVPPFSLQPLVENAVQHGLQSSPNAGRLRMAAALAGECLEVRVSDDGQGVPSGEVEYCFFEGHSWVHGLRLLRRRLQVLFGCSFLLEVCSEVGQGTTVTMRIPLRKRLERTTIPAIEKRSGQFLRSGARKAHERFGS